MPKLKLLILDANVVIYLFENGLWQKVLAQCEIHLSRIVAEDEVRYYHGRDADKLIDISLSCPCASSKRAHRPSSSATMRDR